MEKFVQNAIIITENIENLHKMHNFYILGNFGSIFRNFEIYFLQFLEDILQNFQQFLLWFLKWILIFYDNFYRMMNFSRSFSQIHFKTKFLIFSKIFLKYSIL